MQIPTDKTERKRRGRRRRQSFLNDDGLWIMVLFEDCELQLKITSHQRERERYASSGGLAEGQAVERKVPRSPVQCCEDRISFYLHSTTSEVLEILD
jgi:hypothetical protein